jgi:organic radical activating enzyme
VDRNVKAKEYDALDGDLLVTSIFRTIQGEGPYAGYPSVFVRLAGCNFGSKDSNCQFCDSFFGFDQGRRVSSLQLLEELTSLPGYNSQDVLVVTGGEPTLQLALIELLVKANLYFAHVQIETNGTQSGFFKRVEELNVQRQFMTVVSPKASYLAKRYSELSPIVMWNATCLKFVVDSDPESPHHIVPQWAFDSQKKIYVSPMAVYLKPYAGEVSSIWEDGLIDKAATEKNYKYAAEYAMKHNVLLSVQTHLFLGLA